MQDTSTNVLKLRVLIYRRAVKDKQ